MFIGSMAGTGLHIVFAAAGVVVALFGLYLVVLAVAAFFYPRPAGTGQTASTRLAVLIPAFNEAALIVRCVKSLRSQTYPAHLYEIFVVADNCTDGTAANARAAGAQVIERHEPNARGKGRALRFAIDQLLLSQPPPEAIVVVDADSVADPGFLTALVARFEEGADAVQGESLLFEDGSARTALRAAAFLLVNRVRPAGRAVLGLQSTLAGNGMLLGRTQLLANPWRAFTSAEDLEYALELRKAGARIAFGGGAIVYSPAAPDASAAELQQLRWEGGKLHLARVWIPTLVWSALRERRPSLLDTAFALATPPLGFLAAAAAAGVTASAALASAGLLPLWTTVPWFLALAAIPLHALIGLRAGRAPASAYRALLRAPVFVAAKIVTIPRVLRFRADTWIRTARAQEAVDSRTRRTDAPG